MPRAAKSAAFNTRSDKRVISIMGDGGFWHSGLVSSVGNAVFNKSGSLIVIADNGYSAATGGQDSLSSRHANPTRPTQNAVEKAVRGVGVSWAKTLTNTYDLQTMKDTIRDALTTPDRGPKVIIA